MKKLNKGFTLIELLAVIVILAIILLIAVPMIANVVEDVKKGAFISSVSMIVKSVEYENSNEAKSNIDLTALNYSGKRYETGSISINSQGQIEAYIWNDELKMCAVKNFNSKDVVINTALDETTCSSGPSGPIDIDSSDLTYPCYTFNSSTGTITNYNTSNPICPKAFYSPTSIDGVNVIAIGDANGQIGEYFTSIDLSDAIYLERIEDFAFGHYAPYIESEVTTVEFPNPSVLVYIGVHAFIKNNISTLTIPETVTTIREQAFQENNLTTITIPSNVTLIGSSAFNGNTLTSITIKGASTSIEDYAFISNNISTITFDGSGVLLGDSGILDFFNTYIKDAYTLGGAGTYTGTQTGVWTKN